MKFLVTLALLVLAAFALAKDIPLTPEQEAKFKVYCDECKKRELVTEEEVLKFRNKDFNKPSDKLKCFVKCIFELSGSLQNGVLQEDVALAQTTLYYGEDRAKLMMKKCINVKGDNECDTAFQLFECFENAKLEVMA